MYSIEASITKQNSPPGFTFPTLPCYEPQPENQRPLHLLGPSSSNFLQYCFPLENLSWTLQSKSTEGKVSSKKSQFRHHCLKKAIGKSAAGPTGIFQRPRVSFLVKNIETVAVLGGPVVWFWTSAWSRLVSLRARRAADSAQSLGELIRKFLISSSNCLAWTSRWVTSSRSLRISSCCR